MKKIIPLLSLITLLGISYVQPTQAAVIDTTAGNILLQVEENGEAWYVYPEDEQRYFLGRPDDAFDIMQTLGLGISNDDLATIPEATADWDANADMLNRVEGYILLQVEENGEAWYVYPETGKRYFLGRPSDAFDIMRSLGLGITTSDLETIIEGEDFTTNGTDLSDAVLEALNKALDDEYKAYTTYEQVIDEFGSVKPFSNIINAEDKHINALLDFYNEYGISIPENPYEDVVLIDGIDTVAEACAVGVQAEIDNASLYEDELLPAIKEYDYMTQVFTNLMNASQDNHLPAFENCGGR